MNKQEFKQKLIDFGLTEEKLALETICMIESPNDRLKVAAFNKVWKLFDLESKEEYQVDDENILLQMGMNELMLTVQERRRLAQPQQAEVIEDGN